MMAKVTVYKVRFYDIQSDEFSFSRRMATEKGAARMHGEVMENTAVEIDASQLEQGEEWTPRGFNPHQRTGFQTRVTT
jgi:hypothetical protein